MATLYLIATPIGNLGDLSPRAVEVLKQVDTIACEDTRTSGFLLHHFEVKKPLISFHSHNEHKKLQALSDLLDAGNHIALISDAGMPAISDPGFLAVRQAHLSGHEVIVIPGPSAAISALAASGLPSDRFCFEGFLPQKKGRKTRIEQLTEEARTMIFFESPYRILKLLDELSLVFGSDRLACFGRELTKKFEENRRGTLSELKASLSERPSIKGEFVLIVAGKDYTE
ncbi:MAG: 16S rRNA (cytidine(1402)-2'-O)-methyltransferase [Bacteroidetes bacterium]|nr:16S rRNA (cytidine(1402)-2'-O)-methyltransferase [Bacteroidota bacterium]MCH8523648.1 16S rRNA (cytidine(1402)-2'-O)-methyltransferase [Balneolales bacterium]